MLAYSVQMGSGKSTFVRTISGVIPKCCGEFTLAADIKKYQWFLNLKMQFQYPLTVKEVLLFYLKKFTLFPKK